MILAVAMGKAGDEAKSVEVLLSATDQFPDEGLLRRNLAAMLLRLGRNAEAVMHGRAAVSIDPENEVGHYNLACIEAVNGNHAEALASLQRAVDINPDWARAARDDPDFVALAQDPTFLAIVK